MLESVLIHWVGPNWPITLLLLFLFALAISLSIVVARFLAV